MHTIRIGRATGAEAASALRAWPGVSIREERESRMGSARFTPAARRKKRRPTRGFLLDTRLRLLSRVQTFQVCHMDPRKVNRLSKIEFKPSSRQTEGGCVQ